jgi:hypothetical protein
MHVGQATLTACLGCDASACLGARAQGTSLSNNQIFGVVNCAITRKQVPYMTNAVYMVLGASNIQATSGAEFYTHAGSCRLVQLCRTC